MLQFGKYDLIAEIGRGGMGVVYLAVAQGPARFRKLLALKELKAELAEDPAFLSMFLEEARLAASLSHPNIAQTYDVGFEDGRHFMVMDYLEGVQLAQMQRRNKTTFTADMQLFIACQVLEALEYTHSLRGVDGKPLNLVHRDVTPQNVFITFDGQVKLVDFGIAKALSSVSETRAGTLKGKPAYMAPEQLTGRIDRRTDVFAMGVVVWEAVAGRRMWPRKDDMAIFRGLSENSIPSLREAAPDAPQAIVDIVTKALAPKPEDRFQTAADFEAALHEYLAAKARMHARDVGAVVSETFATEHTKIRGLIEQYMNELRTGEAALNVAPPRLPGEASENSTGGRNRRVSIAQLDSSSIRPPASLTLGTPSGAEVPSMQPMPRSARREWVGVLAVALVAVAAVTLVALKSIGRDAAPPAVAAVQPVAPTSDAPHPIPPTPVAAPPPSSTTHELQFQVLPANATLTLDGAPLASPFKRTCAQGTRVLLRASAPGFIAREREILCERDELLSLSLAQPGAVYVQQAAAPPPAVTPRQTATPVAPPPTTPPTKATNTGRPIDMDNPWN